MMPSTLYVTVVKVPVVLIVIAVAAFARICMGTPGYAIAPIVFVTAVMKLPLFETTSLVVLCVFVSSK